MVGDNDDKREAKDWLQCTVCKVLVHILFLPRHMAIHAVNQHKPVDVDTLPMMEVAKPIVENHDSSQTIKYCGKCDCNYFGGCQKTDIEHEVEFGS